MNNLSTSAGTPGDDMGWLSGGGEMGELIRSTDWSQTPLGPIQAWPPNLKTAAGIMLGAGTPISIGWGPDQILLYNDAWKASVGDKHPAALGRPAREVFAEMWEIMGPLVAGVMSGQGAAQARRQLLPIYRYGRGELSWVDYSFSPIRCADGSIGGVFSTTVEVTEQVRAEQSLRASEERLRLSVENLLDAFAVYSSIRDEDNQIVDFRVEYVNQAACTLTGRKREDYLGKTVLDLYPGLDQTEIFDCYVQAVEKNQASARQSFAFDASPYGQPGTRYYDYRITRLGDGFTATWRDVTERVRAEDALRETEQRYRELVRRAPAGIYEVDFHSQRFTSVNDAMCEMLGYSREELLALNPLDILDEEGQALFRERMARWLAGEQSSSSVEYRATAKDGRVLYELLNVTFTVDEHGAPLGATVVAHDITERKRAEQERERLLVEVERRAAEAEEGQRTLQALMEYVPEGIAIADAPDATLRMVSRYGTELLGSVHTGMTVEEVAGQWTVYAVDGETLMPGDELPLVRAIRHGEEVRDIELVQKNARGERLWLLCNAGPIRDAKGQVTGGIVAWRDVAERRRAEAELRRERELLQVIYDTIPVMLTIYDPLIEHISVNRYLERVTGWTQADRAHTHIMELVYPDPDYRSQVAAYMQSLQPGYKDLKMATKSGQTIESSWANVRLPDGRQVGIGIDITERKQAEEKIRRQNAVLSGVARILHAALTCQTEEALGRACLEVVEEVTHSQFAFIGEINLETDRLEDGALSHPGWDACRMSYLSDSGNKAPIDFEIHGLYGRVLRSGHSLIANDPSSHPDSTGLPPGHPPLRAFLGVPLIREGETIGMIGLGNREGGYEPEDVESVEALAPAIVQSFLSYRAEQALAAERESLELRVQERTEALIQANQELRREFAERERAELALRESEAHFRTTFESAALGIAVVNQAGGLVDSNAALQAMLGYSAEELRDMSLHELLHPEDRAKGMSPLQELLAGKKDSYRLEARSRHKDGDERWISLTVSSARGADGEVDFMIGMVQDVTRQKEIQEALIRSEKLALAARLTGSLAHEIKNPLQAIIGCVTLAGEALRDGEEPGAFLDYASEELWRTVSLVDQLSSLHRPAAPHEKRDTDVNAVLQRVLELNAVRCRETGVEVTWHPAADLPSLWVARGRLQQVFLNLLVNALDAMPRGGALAVRTQASHAPDGVWVTFEDTGPGIPPETLAHLFEPFYTTKETGLGLGLYICQDIIKEHGGRIEVSSTAGQGATFAIWLPLSTAGDQSALGATKDG